MPDQSLLPHGPGQFALALLPAVVLPWRRRLPLPTLAASVVLMVTATAIGFGAPGVVLAIAISSFAVASHTPRRLSIPALSVALIVTAVASAVVAGRISPADISPLAFTIAFAGALGDATRSRREHLESMTIRAITAERARDAVAHARVMEERLRIARDLHDVVAHQITVISLNAGVVSAGISSPPPPVDAALQTIRAASRSILSEIGGLLGALRETDGAGDSPQVGLEDLAALYDSFSTEGVEIVRRSEGDLTRVPHATGLVAYRIIREGITNALKHGIGKRVYVRIIVGDDDVEVLVSNPVAVEDTTDGPRDVDSRFGLLGLRERASSVRGHVSAHRRGDQFQLEARLPIDEPRTAQNEETPP